MECVEFLENSTKTKVIIIILLAIFQRDCSFERNLVTNLKFANFKSSKKNLLILYDAKIINDEIILNTIYRIFECERVRARARAREDMEMLSKAFLKSIVSSFH